MGTDAILSDLAAWAAVRLRAGQRSHDPITDPRRMIRDGEGQVFAVPGRVARVVRAWRERRLDCGKDDGGGGRTVMRLFHFSDHPGRATG